MPVFQILDVARNTVLDVGAVTRFAAISDPKMEKASAAAATTPRKRMFMESPLNDRDALSESSVVG